jgi:hypothetical protein
MNLSIMILICCLMWGGCWATKGTYKSKLDIKSGHMRLALRELEQVFYNSVERLCDSSNSRI